MSLTTARPPGSTMSASTAPRLVALTGGGRRAGETHPRAKLSDAEVELVHGLRESGLSLAKIAEKMSVSKACVAHICSGRRRGQIVERWVLAMPSKPSSGSKSRWRPKAPVEDPVLVLQDGLQGWR